MVYHYEKCTIYVNKSALKLIGLIGASSTVDAGIQKKVFKSGTTRLITSSKEKKDIMKTVNSLEYSGVLLKYVFVKKLKEKQKNKKVDFLVWYKVL